MKVGIAFSTKDRVELSDRTVRPLMSDKFSLLWVDGSVTEEGRAFPHKASLKAGGNHSINVHGMVRGGADAAIVYGLSTLLMCSDLTHVGLIENDVLLTAPDWFERTMALFDKGAADGLSVGAVSARCYADRMLCQRDGYGLMHNLGAGMVIFTRHAARLVLDHFRTGWTMANRAVFAQLAGTDIGRYWAFKSGEHWLCADWGFDRVLAAHGLASLALTPSPVEMIGQDPPLDQQGLTLVTEEIGEFRNPEVFARFYKNSLAIGVDQMVLPSELWHADNQGYLIFAHQLASIGGRYKGDWRLKWFQGFGPFAWESHGPLASATIPVFGPCHVLMRGGPEGGQAEIKDPLSGFSLKPNLSPDVLMAAYVPAGMAYRELTVTALSPGVVFHGIQCPCQQPRTRSWFAHEDLPPAGILP